MTINYNQQYFMATKFCSSVLDLKNIPSDSKLEIAIAGRSNCGKSSLINAITQQAKLAIISKQPGRTQALNYFQIKPNKYLVDLPGYGYAKVNNNIRISWERLLDDYFTNNSRLIGIILVMDLRHAFKPTDQQMLIFCAHHNLPIHIVLNKADQVTKAQINTALQQAATIITAYPNNISFQAASATRKQGITQLCDQLVEWIENS